MNHLQATITDYLDYCQYQKRLDAKTLKAYRIDLNQAVCRFREDFAVDTFADITPAMLERYITFLHKSYQPKTVKRKIASLEADVDIHYIQEMLGHSSIHVTEIYTHVAMAKQKDILTTKHPRKDLRV